MGTTDPMLRFGLFQGTERQMRWDEGEPLQARFEYRSASLEWLDQTSNGAIAHRLQTSLHSKHCLLNKSQDIRTLRCHTCTYIVAAVEQIHFMASINQMPCNYILSSDFCEPSRVLGDPAF